MKSSPRHARVEEEIRKILAQLLMFEVKDPRLDGVTVSAIELSADLSTSKVFFSLIGEADRERQVNDGFSAARSFLRRELGRRIRLRVTPELVFMRDPSYEYGDKMERLFERLHEEGVLSDADNGVAKPGES